MVLVVLSLATLVLSPTLAGKAMGLKGGLGKGAVVGFVSLGLMQIVGMVSRFLGPLGDVLAIFGSLAAWYQVVKVVHGTDTAKTIVFMIWQLFFQLLVASLLGLFLGAAAFSWYWT